MNQVLKNEYVQLLTIRHYAPSIVEELKRPCEITGTKDQANRAGCREPKQLRCEHEGTLIYMFSVL